MKIGIENTVYLIDNNNDTRIRIKKILAKCYNFSITMKVFKK
jgi:hypothetical protein